MLCISRENSLKYPTYFFLEEWEEKKKRRMGKKGMMPLTQLKNKEGGIGLLGEVINAF